MTRKSAIYALAVAVLMGTMAVAAMAGEQQMVAYGYGAYGPEDSTFLSQPEVGTSEPAEGEIREPVETGANQPAEGDMRGPVETGALPEGFVHKDAGGWVNMNVEEQNASPELRGLPNIQSGE